MDSHLGTKTSGQRPSAGARPPDPLPSAQGAAPGGEPGRPQAARCAPRSALRLRGGKLPPDPRFILA